MLHAVALSPFVASAQSAAAETHFVPIFLCRLTTILPIVAAAVPVFWISMYPFTLRKLAVVSPRVAVTVHVMVCWLGVFTGSGVVTVPLLFCKVQSVLLW